MNSSTGLPIETLIDLLDEAAQKYGERIALSIEVGGQDDAWSYERLWLTANSIPGYLQERYAIQAGDRVLIWGAPTAPT